MPVLKNSRHERFAQLLAKGLPASRAYADAGYTAKGHGAEVNGSQLLRKAEVAARVVELKTKVADRLVVTQESLVKNLTSLRRRAAKCKKYAAAVSAESAIARITGHWTAERKNDKAPLEDVSDENLYAALRANVKAIGGNVDLPPARTKH